MYKLLAPLFIFLLFSCRQADTIPISNLANESLNNAILLDVRTPEEYSFGHIESAVNVNWYDIDFKEKVSEFDRSKNIYLYCKAGGRSAKAAEVMKEMGFKNVVNLDGGYDAYLESKK